MNQKRFLLLLSVLMLLALSLRAAAAEQAERADMRAPGLHQLSTQLLASSRIKTYLPLITKQAQPPAITSFSAQPASITPGQSSTLSWKVTGATSLTISPGVGAVSGSSVAVSPAMTTEYTLTASNAGGTVTARTTVTVLNQPDDTKGTFFLPYEINQVNQTYSSSVAVDPRGGIHIAYMPSTDEASGNQPAYYAYCAARCASATSFTAIALGGNDDYIADLSLALDSQGRPRLLWRVYGGFRYAECNSACTSPTNWTIGKIGRLDIFSDGSNRAFALDAQGHPRFVFYDEEFGDHGGTFYMYCDANCTRAASWTERKLNDSFFKKASLALTITGLPRLAFQVADGFATTPHFGYLECNTPTCATPPQSFTWFDIHALYASFALQLDSHDRPRVALYTGPIASARAPGDPGPRQTVYLWCNSTCATKAGWGSANLNLPAMGKEYRNVALALNRQDQPRLVYEISDALAYGWCSASCETPGAVWHRLMVDTDAAAGASAPVPPDPGCGTSVWSVGHKTSLALDAAGNPRIGYDARQRYCGKEIWRSTWARFALFPQP